ncbi:hypothetical protein Ocin01_08908 [Orchesella cincta]|uniref:Uncharacterized protein n=1 Tax=Orchesella cincta TaxID=48709 RepID=A0A1D2MXV7_ORCCI|nr:hypothetical protein Ocin01_08908 [Orchesella cincta]
MIFYLGILLSSSIALSYATVGGQYSVNVHFVPPLVTAQCSIAQFWSPSNVTCALCFCMTGSLSRCIPQPGCNPQAQNTTSTTTMSSDPTDQNTTENPSGTSPMPGESSSPSSEASMNSTSTEAPTDAPPAAPDTPPDQGTGSKVRGPKPSKSRRRRHSGY